MRLGRRRWPIRLRPRTTTLCFLRFEIFLLVRKNLPRLARERDQFIFFVATSQPAMCQRPIEELERRLPWRKVSAYVRFELICVPG